MPWWGSVLIGLGTGIGSFLGLTALVLRDRQDDKEEWDRKIKKSEEKNKTN